jgi:hypothetical protein
MAAAVIQAVVLAKLPVKLFETDFELPPVRGG